MCRRRNTVARLTRRRRGRTLIIMIENAPASYAERLWDLGQQHLAAGLYTSARQHLESAEALYWRSRDAAGLARIYLPLLEVRRQLRHLAVDGIIAISESPCPHERNLIKTLTAAPAGILIAGHVVSATKMLIASRRLARSYDALVRIRDHHDLYIASPFDPKAAAGLHVRSARSTQDTVDPEIRKDMIIPLPGPGVYQPGSSAHAQARESLLVAWEALALKWQSRHPTQAEPWTELAACRNALRIDPACEPITMRLIALAERLSRRK